jgi:chromosome segregation ATPase
VLQKYSKQGVPDGAFVPKSLEQFRLWKDDELRLHEIGSKSTLYQPWNRELRTKVVSLIKTLTARQKTSIGRRTVEDRLRAEIVELKFTLKQLAGDLHETRQELQFERRERERGQHRMADLKEENSKLTAQLRQHAGLYSVK